MQKIESMPSGAAEYFPPVAASQISGGAFGPLARAYRWLEYGAFGRGLMQSRLDLLPWLADAKRVLTLGEGDGRFVTELVRRFSETKVDCVESSGEMIQLAQARLRPEARVSFHRSDAREWKFPSERYDAVVTCFFLDCFQMQTLEKLMPNIAGSLKPSGHWMVAEFAQPSRGLSKWRAKLWLTVLYRFFAHFAKMETRQLPAWQNEMARLGFNRTEHVPRNLELIAASRWSRPEKSRKTEGNSI